MRYDSVFPNFFLNISIQQEDPSVASCISCLREPFFNRYQLQYKKVDPSWGTCHLSNPFISHQNCFVIFLLFMSGKEYPLGSYVKSLSIYVLFFTSLVSKVKLEVSFSIKNIFSRNTLVWKSRPRRQNKKIGILDFIAKNQNDYSRCFTWINSRIAHKFPSHKRQVLYDFFINLLIKKVSPYLLRFWSNASA